MVLAKFKGKNLRESIHSVVESAPEIDLLKDQQLKSYQKNFLKTLRSDQKQADSVAESKLEDEMSTR